MVTVFGSYEEFVERVVVPLREKNPSWRSLNGDVKRSDPSAYAKLIFEDVRYRVHADAYIDSLLGAYNLAKSEGLVSSVKVGFSSKGKTKLVPASDRCTNKGFYVYLDD